MADEAEGNATQPDLPTAGALSRIHHCPVVEGHHDVTR
jgi:hypothetical protein